MDATPIRESWAGRWAISARDDPTTVLGIVIEAAGRRLVDPDRVTVVGTARFAEWLGVPIDRVNSWRRFREANGMPEARWTLSSTGTGSGSVDAWYLERDLLPWLVSRARRAVTHDWEGLVIRAIGEIIKEHGR